jgi:small subunit ribosomal protein S21
MSHTVVLSPATGFARLQGIRLNRSCGCRILPHRRHWQCRAYLRADLSANGGLVHRCFGADFNSSEKHRLSTRNGVRNLQVFVRDNNVDQALRALKRKMQREGLYREMRRRRFYEKPSDRATREKSEAIRRRRKLARKQAVRDGLIPAPSRKKQIEGSKRRVGSPAAPVRIGTRR